MKTKTKKKHFAIIILSLIFLFHLINNLTYVHLDTRPPAWDQSWHSAISLSYYNSLTGKGEGDLEKVSDMFYERSLRYPHLFHISSCVRG